MKFPTKEITSNDNGKHPKCENKKVTEKCDSTIKSKENENQQETAKSVKGEKEEQNKTIKNKIDGNKQDEETQYQQNEQHENKNIEGLEAIDQEGSKNVSDYKSETTKSEDTLKTPSPPPPPPLKDYKENELIEIEDHDDYLLYLEAILKLIHRRFYEVYDEKKVIPDLKILIPQLRSKVLRGLNLVFSGLVPNQVKLEQSRAYLIARSLGANVTQNLTEETTHLIAVTVGTFKYNAARKRKDIKIVTPEWLWCCAERWEKVDEELFPLDPNLKSSKIRNPPLHCHSPEHTEHSSLNKPVDEPKFIDTINPLLSFSNDDIDEMNQEFDQFFESDSSTDEENIDIGKLFYLYVVIYTYIV